jgi:hypothetical protein
VVEVAGEELANDQAQFVGVLELPSVILSVFPTQTLFALALMAANGAPGKITRVFVKTPLLPRVFPATSEMVTVAAVVREELNVIMPGFCKLELGIDTVIPPVLVLLKFQLHVVGPLIERSVTVIVEPEQMVSFGLRLNEATGVKQN